MKAGELDQRITVLAPTVVQNALNEDVETFAQLRRPWARAMEEKGREFVAADQMTALHKVAFKIRWAANITEQCRVEWRDRTYEILNITGTYRSGEMWLHCQSLPKVNP